ncbi:hypothetical protein [Rhodococcus jostii]|nr:hypothetical protein [Rhodococcus jostii]
MTHVRRFALLLAAGAVVALSGCSTPTADSTAPTTSAPAAASDGVRVAGAVDHPLELTDAALRGYAPHTESVEFDSSKGPQAHTYVGALLSDVVDSADPREAESKNPLLRLVVRAAASDGYVAVVSFGEFSPDFAATPVLVAYEEDGQPLDQPRLVVPGDRKGGRYVSDLTDLTVVDAGA